MEKYGVDTRSHAMIMGDYVVRFLLVYFSQGAYGILLMVFFPPARNDDDDDEWFNIFERVVQMWFDCNIIQTSCLLEKRHPPRSVVCRLRHLRQRTIDLLRLYYRSLYSNHCLSREPWCHDVHNVRKDETATDATVQDSVLAGERAHCQYCWWSIIVFLAKTTILLPSQQAKDRNRNSRLGFPSSSSTFRAVPHLPFPFFASTLLL